MKRVRSIKWDDNGKLPGRLYSLCRCRIGGKITTEWTDAPGQPSEEYTVIEGETQSGRTVRATQTTHDNEPGRWSFSADFGEEGSASFAADVLATLAACYEEDDWRIEHVVVTFCREEGDDPADIRLYHNHSGLSALAVELDADTQVLISPTPQW